MGECQPRFAAVCQARGGQGAGGAGLDESVSSLRGLSVSLFFLPFVLQQVCRLVAVQAVLVTQTSTAEILRGAFHHIEDYHCSMFAFSCRGATHRSVACCVLFAAIVYRDAKIVLTTWRTLEAARRMGLLGAIRGE